MSVCLCLPWLWNPVPPLPKSLANTKEKPNSCYKAAHCEGFNILTATSATRRAAWLGEEAKTLVASGQRRPFRRRDGIKNVHYSHRKFVSLFNVPTDFESSATTPSSLPTSASNSALCWTTVWCRDGSFSNELVVTGYLFIFFSFLGAKPKNGLIHIHLQSWQRFLSCCSGDFVR